MIKEGYKKTVLGIIPESWEIKELNKITSLITNGFVGKATDHYTTSEDGVLYIQGYNVEGFGFNFNGIKYVTKEFHLKNKKSILKKGDLLTIQTGDVGLTAYVPKELEGSNCHALIITRYIKDKAHSKFYHQYFNSIIGRYRLSRIETGSTMKHINCGDLKKLLIPIPPLPEQQAIANCLTTWDKGIETLTALIEAKREQKKGLMQQIFSGKLKVDNGQLIQAKEGENFIKDWKKVRINEISKLGRGRVISKKEIESNLGKYPVYSSQTTNNGVFGYLNTYDFEGEYITWTTDGVNAGSVFYRTGKFNCTNVCGTVKLKKGYDYYFVKSALDRVAERYVSRTLANPKLMNGVFGTIEIMTPSYNEQTAIANILSTADQEISLLEQKLEAMKEEKKGLMQVLLTGEKRLIDN